MTVYSKGSETIYDLYIDKFKKVNPSPGEVRYVLDNDLVPYQLRMSYIAKPATVKYCEDLDGVNVDCDLPDYMHVDVLKHAADLYRIIISGALQTSQQQSQQQAQENARNNYRNDGTTQ